MRTLLLTCLLLSANCFAGWTFKESIDPITDDRMQGAITYSTDDVHFTNKSVLGLRCINGGLSVLIQYDLIHLLTRRVKVVARFDKQEPIDLHGSISKDNKAVFFRDDDLQQVTDGLKHSSRLVVRVYREYGNPLTNTYDIAGLDQHLPKFDKECLP